MISTQKNEPESVLIDLSKIGLTSLALLGFFGGCSSQKTTSEIIKSRETVSADAILNNPQRWINREVNLHAIPELQSDRSRLYFDGGDSSHLYLNLNLVYGLRENNQISEEKILMMVDNRAIEMCGKSFPAKDPAQEYILSSDTYIVSGTIKQFSDTGRIYLEYSNSERGGPK